MITTPHADAAQIDTLPPLRTTIETNKLNTKKSLGQHFLFDLQLIDKIVSHAGDLDGQTVIEVGPGPGGLTRCLLRRNIKKLIVIERDHRCAPILHELKNIAGDRLDIIEADALKIDYHHVIPAGEQAHIIANLPYNIGTELIFTWLKSRTLFASFTLMLQKEVVDRITAAPNSKDFGRLAVMSQWLCECYSIMNVHPSAFVPPPKVDSAIVQMNIRTNPAAVDQAMLEKIVQTAFGQRRKMLRASLKSLCSESQLAAANIAPTARPEVLTLQHFIDLANQLAK